MRGKFLLLAAAFALAAGHTPARAQDAAGADGQNATPAAAQWQRRTFPGEEFWVEWPAAPDVYHTRRRIKDSLTEETETARVYSCYHDGVVYAVASFDAPRSHESLAFFAAEFLNGPELPLVQGTFRKDVLSGKVRGWQYEFEHRGAKGVARFYLTSKHAYMIQAVGGDESHPAVGRYLNSFELSREARGGDAQAGTAPRLVGSRPASPPTATPTPQPTPTPRQGKGGEGAGGSTAPAAPDHATPFRMVDVTSRAVVVFKPTPGFTEEARKNNVTGLVRLRAVLSSAGTVTNIAVIKGLPDGLTEKAIAAARRIRFIPAVMDGRRVSQWVTLEYNFHIY